MEVQTNACNFKPVLPTDETRVSVSHAARRHRNIDLQNRKEKPKMETHRRQTGDEGEKERILLYISDAGSRTPSAS